jgi:hypothetical protein
LFAIVERREGKIPKHKQKIIVLPLNVSEKNGKGEKEKEKN